MAIFSFIILKDCVSSSTVWVEVHLSDIKIVTLAFQHLLFAWGIFFSIHSLSMYLFIYWYI